MVKTNYIFSYIYSNVFTFCSRLLAAKIKVTDLKSEVFASEPPATNKHVCNGNVGKMVNRQQLLMHASDNLNIPSSTYLLYLSFFTYLTTACCKLL